MKGFFRILLAVIAVCLIAAGARFAADNAQPVALAWGASNSPQAPLFIWLVAVGLGSFLLAWLAFALTLSSQRSRIRRLESQLQRQVGKGINSGE